MEELSPTVALPFRRFDNVMEITRLKLIADTASIIADPSPPSSPSSSSFSPAAAAVDDMDISGEPRDLEIRTSIAAPASGDEGSTAADPTETEQSVGSPSSVISDTSSIASAEDFPSAFDTAVYDTSPSPVDLLKSLSNVVDIVAGTSDESAVALPPSVADVAVRRSVFFMDYVPLWGSASICGWRPEMEDAVVAIPRFFDVPLRMLTSELVIDGINPDAIKIPAHFFGVYDGHGGAQVANYCRERVHVALAKELTSANNRLKSTQPDEWKRQWERAFTNCFLKVDDEVGGKTSSGAKSSDGVLEEGSSIVEVPMEPIAPDTVGSTAVVGVVCSSHIMVANCGDSRAVLYRGKEPMPLSADHKPNREDEYARIEAAGGKVIQWYGYRVSGILAMSRSIGDRYLKPLIIPNPEVTIVPRAKEDECLVLASDGLWDVLSNEEVCETAKRRLLLWHKKYGSTTSSFSRGEGADPAAQAAADYLSKLAIQKGSKDNITVIVVDLKAQRKFKNKA